MKEINVKHGFRYRIYPTEEQKKYFAKAFAANIRGGKREILNLIRKSFGKPF